MGSGGGWTGKRLEPFHLIVAANRNQTISRANDAIRRRIEYHLPCDAFQRQDDYAGTLRDSRILESLACQTGLLGNAHLSNFDIQTLGADRRIEEIQHV